MSELRLSAADAPAAGALKGRVIVITGAAGGLGRALAETAAALGATVVLLDQSVAGLEQVYDAIESSGCPQPAIYPMDLLGAGPSDYAELATTLEDEFGSLNGIVHNAAQLGKPAPIAHYDIETWYRTIQVNLHAPFLLTRYCLPVLERGNRPRLIGISDTGGRSGMPFYGAYGVSKWGLEGLLQTLVAELPAHTALRVSSVDPGGVSTPLRGEAYPAEPADQLPTPAAVAAALTALLDPAFDPVQGGCYTYHR